MKMPKILFFIAGMAPTEAENEAAAAIGIVAMRNRSAISPTDHPEKTDAVAGEVIPVNYKELPVVKSLAEAIAIVREKAKAEIARVKAGDPTFSDLIPAPAQVVGKEAATPGKNETPGKSKTAWQKNA